LVGHCLDPCRQGDDLVITCHHDNRAELQAFGQMHGADRHVTPGRFHVLTEHCERQAGMLDGHLSAVEFRQRTDEYAHFVRHHTLVGALRKPCPNRLAFLVGAFENLHGGCRPVEDRNRAGSLFGIPIDISQFGTQQTIRLRSDLV
jgi:hypothetical protein